MASKRPAVEEASAASKRSRLSTGVDLKFNDKVSSDVVIELVGSTKALSAEVNLHRSILVEGSAFFAAQLSDRWFSAHGNHNDRRFQIKDCRDFSLYMLALEKLYEKVPGATDIWRSHKFSDFEEAFDCLQPADQLGLQSVYASAVAYLESIPWTQEQGLELRVCVETYSLPAKGLLERLEPATAEDQRELIDALFQRVAERESAKSRLQACRLIEELLKPNEAGRGVVLEALHKYLGILKDRLSDRTSKVEVGVMIRDLAWIFRVPQAPGDRNCIEIIADLLPMIQAVSPPLAYQATYFLWLIESKLYPDILKLVLDGALVLDQEHRVKLLNMYYCLSTAEESKEVDPAFAALLSTIPKKAQHDLMKKWLPELIKLPWRPWFDKWMRTMCFAEKEL